MFDSVNAARASNAHIAYVTLGYAAHIRIMLFAFRAVVACGKSTFKAHFTVVAPFYTLAFGAAFALRAF